MWYWLIKFEGAVLLLPVIIYYALRGIPFYTKCRKCHRQLFDAYLIRMGLCENCLREMATLNGHELSEQWYKKTETKVYDRPEYYCKRIAKKVGQGKILDVGCGLGYFLSLLKSPQLYGMDHSIEAVAIANNRLERANFCSGDIRNMPFKSNTFDYLICTDVLEHVQGNDGIIECYRVLKPNGIGLFTVPSGKGPSGKTNPSHIRLFTFEHMVKSLEEAGFEITHTQKIGLYILFVTPFLQVIPTALGKYLPPILDIKVPEWLATHFFIECRKPPV